LPIGSFEQQIVVFLEVVVFFKFDLVAAFVLAGLVLGNPGAFFFFGFPILAFFGGSGQGWAIELAFVVASAFDGSGRLFEELGRRCASGGAIASIGNRFGRAHGLRTA
jgi:hypothetical protein